MLHNQVLLLRTITHHSSQTNFPTISVNTNGVCRLRAAAVFFLQAHNLSIHITKVICENEYN